MLGFDAIAALPLADDLITDEPTSTRIRATQTGGGPVLSADIASTGPSIETN